MLFAGIENLISGEGFRFSAISTYGVYFICPFFLLAFAKIGRREIRGLFDVFALYAMPSLFLIRCNCLMAGCCGGTEIPGTNLHWPTREAEMLFYIFMLFFLIRREKNGAVRGTAFPLLMICYGGFRFVEEWFRDLPGAGTIHLAHLWSLIAIAAGCSIYFELKTHEEKHRGGKHV